LGVVIASSSDRGNGGFLSFIAQNPQAIARSWLGRGIMYREIAIATMQLKSGAI